LPKRGFIVNLSQTEVSWMESIIVKATAKVAAQKARLAKMSSDDPYRATEEQILAALESSAAFAAFGRRLVLDEKAERPFARGKGQIIAPNQITVL
jgi:hypothetical protein